MVDESTHPAIVSPAPGQALRLIQKPDPPLAPGQVRIRNTWVASSLFDVHQSEGLGGGHPVVLGLNAAGTVVEIGSHVKSLAVGDDVFYFGYATPDEKTYQHTSVVEDFRVGKRPAHIPAHAAATVPDNLVTTFHTLINDLHLELPWPIPDSYIPVHAHTPILIWGGASSVGQYAIQVLRHYGHRNIWTTASVKQHDHLRELGARHVFDYREHDVVEKIQRTLSQQGSFSNDGKTDADTGRGARVPFILDCISSRDGSLTPLARIAQPGATVAALLPVVIKSPGIGKTPEYAWDVDKAVNWVDGVNVTGTRTFTYTERNEFLKKHLQPEIMPALLEQGVILPNRQRIVHGKDSLERAQNAIDLLKGGTVSGERVVWEF